MYKTLLILFLLVTQSLSFDIKVFNDELVQLTAQPVYNLDNEELSRVVKPLIKKYKNIQSLTIRESLDDQILFTFYRDKEKLIFDKETPKNFTKFLNSNADINFNGDKIGTISILYKNLKDSKLDLLNLTQDEKEWLDKNKFIKIAVMNYWSKANDGESYHTDLLKLFRKYSDINIIPVKYDTWKDGYSDVTNSNSVHGIMNLSWSKEREKKYFLYTKAYDYSPNYLIVKNNNESIKFLKDLNGKTVYLKEKAITHNIVNDNVKM